MEEPLKLMGRQVTYTLDREQAPYYGCKNCPARIVFVHTENCVDLEVTLPNLKTFTAMRSSEGTAPGQFQFERGAN
ncbi:MAG TPA: hypothetical protein VGR97_08190 [Candidatus Acidoferrales bacterium]|nr:hypothetical protein [Candidatus Acidoferrales bacterium]